MIDDVKIIATSKLKPIDSKADLIRVFVYDAWSILVSVRVFFESHNERVIKEPVRPPTESLTS